jgi:hypothetical protein
MTAAHDLRRLTVCNHGSVGGSQYEKTAKSALMVSDEHVVRAQDRRDEQADQSQASVECEVPACHRRMIFRAQLVSPLDSCCFTQFERARAIWAGLIRVFIRCNGCQRTSVFSGMKEQRPLLFSPLRLYPKKSGYFAHCPAIISQLLRGCDLRYLHDALGLSSIGHALQAIRAAIYTSPMGRDAQVALADR